MQVYSEAGLRESLEQLETAKLDELLRMELKKETPDVDAVRLIMSILEQRDKATVRELTPREQAAWQRYQQRMEVLVKKPQLPGNFLTAAASLLVIVGLLFAVVPQQAQAETFWQMLQRWSSTVLSYFGREDQFRQMEYVFETDNPGLQQVYDAVVEMGITDPVVPMWLPEHYELVEFEVQKTPALQGVHTRFYYEGSDILYKVNLYIEDTTHLFFRDDAHSETYEKNGMTYNITRNNNRWLVIWTKNNIECSLTLDCPEDTLRKILGSIYVTED